LQNLIFSRNLSINFALNSLIISWKTEQHNQKNKRFCDCFYENV